VEFKNKDAAAQAMNDARAGVSNGCSIPWGSSGGTATFLHSYAEPNPTSCVDPGGTLKSLAEIAQNDGSHISGFYTAVQCGRWIVPMTAVASAGVSYERASALMSAAIGQLSKVLNP
jgi:hypothetical protein